MKTVYCRHGSGVFFLRKEDKVHLDGLVQERRNSNALALELRLSCTKPSIFASSKTSYANKTRSLCRIWCQFSSKSFLVLLVRSLE